MSRKESIDIKKERLERLRRELSIADAQYKHTEHDLTQLQKHRRFLMLIKAGKIIEKVGLLDVYDEDALYLLLSSHYKELIRKD